MNFKTVNTITGRRDPAAAPPLDPFLKREGYKGLLVAALRDVGLYSVADKLDDCNKRLVYYKALGGACGCGRIIPKSCGLRFCPHCGSKEARRRFPIVKHIFNLIPFFRRKFITLTVPNVPHLVGQDVSHLIGSFRRLRQRAWFKKICRGGLYKIEIENKGQGKGWNHHLHVLADMGFCSAFRLSHEWCIATGGQWFKTRVRADCRGNALESSAGLDLVAEGVQVGWSVIAGSGAFGVVTSVFGSAVVVHWKGPKKKFRWPVAGDDLLLSEVRSVDVQTAGAGSIRELCKYISKSAGIYSDGNLVAELMGAIKGKRLFEAFGIYYGIKREFKKAQEKEFVCSHGLPYEFIGECCQGDVYLDKRRGPPELVLLRSVEARLLAGYVDMLERTQ